MYRSLIVRFVYRFQQYQFGTFYASLSRTNRMKIINCRLISYFPKLTSIYYENKNL